MKLVEVEFNVSHNGELNTVVFMYDKYGKPKTVIVERPDGDVAIHNSNGRWKPCATHAKDLIRWAGRERPTSEFAKQRNKTTRPQLRIVTD